MYAVIATSGRQYRVTEGETIVLNRISGEPGDSVTFERVLMVRADDVQIGTPLIEGATVEGEILDHPRAPKVIHFRMRRRHRFMKLRGHRQPLTAVKITSINT